MLPSRDPCHRPLLPRLERAIQGLQGVIDAEKANLPGGVLIANVSSMKRKKTQLAPELTGGNEVRNGERGVSAGTSGLLCCCGIACGFRCLYACLRVCDVLSIFLDARPPTPVPQPGAWPSLHAVVPGQGA